MRRGCHHPEFKGLLLSARLWQHLQVNWKTTSTLIRAGVTRTLFVWLAFKQTSAYCIGFIG